MRALGFYIEEIGNGLMTHDIHASLVCRQAKVGDDGGCVIPFNDKRTIRLNLGHRPAMTDNGAYQLCNIMWIQLKQLFDTLKTWTDVRRVYIEAPGFQLGISNGDETFLALICT